MSEEKEISRRRRQRKRLFGYRWIVKNLPFFLFLSVLAIVYIANGHFADNTVRNINKVNREIKELQYEYKTLKSDVMFQTKQSQLAKSVEPLGLKELVVPPAVLVDTLENEKERNN